MKNILETTGEILDLFKEFQLEDFELDTGDMHIRLSSTPPSARMAATAAPAQAVAAAAAAGPAPKPTADEVDVSTHATIASPMVGTFYRRPAPDKPPYIEEGDLISPNQPVCIIEAMKLMNEIKSDIGGRVVKVMAQNEQPVQEGQVLFLIEPM